MDRGMFVMCVLDRVQMAQQGVGMRCFCCRKDVPARNGSIDIACEHRNERESKPVSLLLNLSIFVHNTVSDDVMQCDLNVVLNMYL